MGGLWPTSRMLRYLGFQNFYQPFILWFSGVVSRLTALTWKGVSFEWSKETGEGFQKLNTASLLPLSSASSTPPVWKSKKQDPVILFPQVYNPNRWIREYFTLSPTFQSRTCEPNATTRFMIKVPCRESLLRRMKGASECVSSTCWSPLWLLYCGLFYYKNALQSLFGSLVRLVTPLQLQHSFLSWGWRSKARCVDWEGRRPPREGRKYSYIMIRWVWKCRIWIWVFLRWYLGSG